MILGTLGTDIVIFCPKLAIRQALCLHFGILADPGTISGHLGAQERPPSSPSFDFLDLGWTSGLHLKSFSGTLESKRCISFLDTRYMWCTVLNLKMLICCRLLELTYLSTALFYLSVFTVPNCSILMLLIFPFFEVRH